MYIVYITTRFCHFLAIFRGNFKFFFSNSSPANRPELTCPKKNAKNSRPKIGHFVTFFRNGQKNFLLANFLDRNGQIGPRNEQIWRQKWTNLCQNGQIGAKMGKLGLKCTHLTQLWQIWPIGQFFTFWAQILNNIPISGLVLEKLAPKLDFFDLPKVKYFWHAKLTSRIPDGPKKYKFDNFGANFLTGEVRWGYFEMKNQQIWRQNGQIWAKTGKLGLKWTNLTWAAQKSPIFHILAPNFQQY